MYSGTSTGRSGKDLYGTNPELFSDLISTVNTESEKSAASFYNSLAEDYHLVYQDWNASIKRQAKVIDELLQSHLSNRPDRILDCTCGIGTQALGLSELNYHVHGTDISSASIQRAQEEAHKRALPVTFQVADIRQLATEVPSQFDVIISFDNSLPHLKNPTDFLLALENVSAKLNSEGIFLGSTRDYDLLLKEKPTSTTPVISVVDGIKTITFQLWEWQENHTYIVDHFTLKGGNNEFETKVRKAEYAAFTRSEMSDLFTEAGFSKIEWLMPDESGFYQPIFIARPG